MLDVNEIEYRLKLHKAEHARQAARRLPRILEPDDRARKAGHYRVELVTGDVYLAKGQKARVPKSRVIFIEIN